MCVLGWKSAAASGEIGASAARADFAPLARGVAGWEGSRLDSKRVPRDPADLCSAAIIVCVCAAIIIICPSHAACHHLSHNFVPADAAVAAICLNISREFTRPRYFLCSVCGARAEILWLHQQRRPKSIIKRLCDAPFFIRGAPLYDGLWNGNLINRALGYCSTTRITTWSSMLGSTFMPSPCIARSIIYAKRCAQLFIIIQHIIHTPALCVNYDAKIASMRTGTLSFHGSSFSYIWWNNLILDGSLLLKKGKKNVNSCFSYFDLI